MQGGRNCLLEYDEKKLRSEQDFISRETEKHTQDAKNTFQKAPDISQFPSRNLNTQSAPIPKTAYKPARLTELPPFSII